MYRRDFFTGCGDFLSTMIGGGGNQYTFSQNGDRDTLVIVFLRGGMDGLNFVAPIDDKDYVAARGGELAIDSKGLTLQKPITDQDFRIHHHCEGLKELYDDKALGIIHACGLTNGTRSHFEAQDLMELGSASDKSLKEGWLTRYLETAGSTGVPAYAVGSATPASLLGYTGSMSFNEPQDMQVEWDERLFEALESVYKGDTPLHRSGQQTLAVLKNIKTKLSEQGGDIENYKPEGGANYPMEWPADGFSKSLKAVAQLIKMDVGLEVATVDFGGWDTHDGQAWRFPGLVKALSGSLLAFYNDLNRYHNKLTVVVMSEFGRRLKANNNGGTDHGHGNVMMVLGGNVNGGRMYGKWPGLSNEELDNGVDLAITTDYRNVLAEVLKKRLANNAVEKVFPGFIDYNPLGILKG